MNNECALVHKQVTMCLVDKNCKDTQDSIKLLQIYMHCVYMRNTHE